MPSRLRTKTTTAIPPSQASVLRTRLAREGSLNGRRRQRRGRGAAAGAGRVAICLPSAKRRTLSSPGWRKQTVPRTVSRVVRARLGMLLVGAAMGAALCAGPAQAAQISQNARFTASDGVSLATTLTGQSPLTARPTVVEFSPYGRGSGTLDPGPAYNSLLVQIRGTGDSDGTFDALGPRTQADVAELLRWACDQPWSDGRLGLNGFSASAITIYNSLHRELPCVKAAVLKSGTFELYRDLIWPGGINNLIPAAGVMGLIGAPALAQGGDRLRRDPASGADVLLGLNEAGLSGLSH